MRVGEEWSANVNTGDGRLCNVNFECDINFYARAAQCRTTTEANKSRLNEKELAFRMKVLLKIDEKKFAIYFLQIPGKFRTFISNFNP